MDHVRIDEGVKRGPRGIKGQYRGSIKKRDQKTGQILRCMPENLLPAEVVDRYLGDERTADIAASYNVARSRLNQWLLEYAEEPWRKAQVARAVTALEQAKDDLASAPDPLTLARAREQLRGAQWELERLFSRIYGQKQEVSVTHTLVVEERLQEDLGAILSGVRATQDKPKALNIITNSNAVDISDAHIVTE